MKNLITQGLRLGQKVSKVLRETYETVTGRLRDDKARNTSGARVAREWLKYAAMLVMLSTIGSGNVWGADATMTAGTNGSTASVSVGGTSHSAIKVGSSSKGGTMTITIPTGANKLSLYAAAWNGVSNLSLNITPTTNVSPTSIALTANSGIANNSPFTFNGSADSYLFNIDLSSITSQTTLTFTSSIAKRFVVWGAKVCYNPTSPTNGTITATTAHLSWTDSKNVNNYEVYYSTSSTAPTASSSGTATTNKYIDLTSLSAGTKYYWWVRAYDSYCKTNWVAGSSFTTAGGSTPTITTSVSTLSNIGYSLVDFSQVVGSFTVSGSNLTNNVTVTPNSHHEICLTENGTYQTTAIELSKGSGTLAATTIYVRMRSGKAAGSYGGNIACASSGATTKNVNTTGNVPFTIQWYANGTLYHTSYAPYATGTGSNLGDLPTPDPDPETYSCDDKTFMGWYDGTYSDASVAPEYVTTTTKINRDKTFRAVFATEETGGEPTAYTAGEEGDFVLASYNDTNSKWYAIPTSPTLSSNKITGEEITVSTSAGSVNYVTGANAIGYTWTIADATYGQTISDGTKYLYHSNGGASGTDLTYGNGTSFSWVIESETGGLTFQGAVISTSTKNSRGLLMQKTNTFGGYSLSNEGNSSYCRIQVLPIGGMTYSDYNTSCTVCSNEVTVSYSDPGNGNTMTVQKGSSSVSSGDALKSCSGITLTVTLTAATHYTATSLSATGVTGVTTTNVGNVYTVTIPADATGTLTLTPTFTEDAYRTIVFKSNGSALFNDGGSATTFDATDKWKQKVYLTEKPVWPTDLAVGQACDADSKAFRGWVADGQTWAGKEASVPDGSTLITDASNFAAAASGSGDVVYHAVWAEASGSGSPHYAKVTSTGDITNGDYLIVYETGSVAFNGSLSTIDATSNYIDVTISDSKITANSTINASKFTIDISNKYIKSASNKYINQSSYANSIAGNDAATAVHSIEINASGNLVVQGTGESGGAYVSLRYNANSDQKRFRFYKTGQEDVQLYKYDAGATYSNYLTTCCENYAVTLTGNGIVSGGTFNASSLQPCVGSSVTLSATLCSGYTQGAWSVVKTADPSVTVTVTDNAFTMPSYAVTVSLATTAKVDHFIDRMHATTGYTGEGASREGCNYTVPNLTNTATPVGSNCDETHYIFVGWVDSDHVGSNGALLDGYNIISGNSVQNATGTTYYAIWAQAL